MSNLVLINKVSFIKLINNLSATKQDINFSQELVFSTYKNQILTNIIIVANLEIKNNKRQVSIFIQSNFWNLKRKLSIVKVRTLEYLLVY